MLLESSDNLIVGESSQLAQYFPQDYSRVSSRNYSEAPTRRWKAVYICFGENRTYLANSQDAALAKSFYEVNCDAMVKAVDHFHPISEKVVVYSTAELWNDRSGPISVTTPYQFKGNHYVLSKHRMTMLLGDKRRYPRVSVAFPFNFNGVHRGGDFLFGKVFHSILNGQRIQLGDTYYYRDILHPSIVAEESAKHRVGEDFMIGSGRVVFVNDLIRTLYAEFGMSYESMVDEKIGNPAHYRNRIFYSDIAACPPDTTVRRMIDELKRRHHVG